MAEVGKKTGSKKTGTKKTASKKGDQPDVQGHTGSKKTGSKKSGTHMKGDQADVQGHVVARNTHAQGRRPQQSRSVAAVPRHVRHLLGPRRGGPRRCHLPSAGSQ